MKKKIALFLAISTLLGACAPNQEGSSQDSESSVSIDTRTLDGVLSALKTGYHLETINTATYRPSNSTSGSQTTYKGYEEIFGSDGKYRHIKYQTSVDSEPKKDAIDYDSLYVRENGDIAEHSLSISNTVESKIVAPKSWRFSYLQNAFDYFSVSDFIEENGSYVFKKENNEEAATYLGCQLRGYPRSGNSSVTTLALTLNQDGSVSFKAELEPYSLQYITSFDVSAIYEGKFVSLGEEVEDIKPIEKDIDQVFENAMDQIATLNFAASGTNYEILAQDGRYEKVDSVSASAWGDGFSYRFYDDSNKLEEDAAYLSIDNKMQRVALYGNNAYLSGLPIDTTVSALWPFSRISSVFFQNEGNGKYILDSKYSGMFNTTRVFTPFATDTVKNLTVTIASGIVKFVSTNDGNGRHFGAKEEMTFSHFGSQSNPNYTVKETSDDLTWEDIIRNENDYLSALKMVGGKNILDAIPVFGSVYSEGKFVDREGAQYLSARISSLEEGDDLLSSYDKKLVASGFSAKDMSDELGNYRSYTKTVENKKLTISPLAWKEANVVTGAVSYVFALDISVS